MTLFAHMGHVLIDVPLYGGPVIVLLVALAISSIRSRRSSG
jgi:hypothetical protein